MKRKDYFWKVCLPQKGNGGSNPSHSANKRRHSDFFATDNKSIKASQKVAVGGKK